MWADTRDSKVLSLLVYIPSPDVSPKKATTCTASSGVAEMPPELSETLLKWSSSFDLYAAPPGIEAVRPPSVTAPAGRAGLVKVIGATDELPEPERATMKLAPVRLVFTVPPVMASRLES